MNRREMLHAFSAAAIMPLMAHSNAHGSTGSNNSRETVFELRVYHTYEGKLDDLLARFRNHTRAIFERHNIRNVAYWTPLDEPLKGRTLFYIIAHPSRDAATENWKKFREDPEWIKVQTESEANGKLVEKVDSTFLALTDFSAAI